MKRIRSFINRNKKAIIKVLIIAILVILGIQLLNYIVKIQNETKLNENNTTTATKDYGQDKEILGGETKTEKEYTTQKSIMQQFVDYCNNKDYENAYNLLTDECKTNIYPNLNMFKVNYCDIYFQTKKTCGFQLWRDNTYKIEIRDDLMTTGKYDENNYSQDYYTINGQKLNIKGYIKKSKINKSNSKENVIIELNDIDYYIDYAEVNITVKNMTENTILLDNGEYNNDIVLINNKKAEYNSYVVEMAEDELLVNRKETNQLKIKMNLSYSDELKLEEMKFKGLILNYEEYKNLEKTDSIQFTINM